MGKEMRATKEEMDQQVFIPYYTILYYCYTIVKLLVVLYTVVIHCSLQCVHACYT
jgi:hypothetical protein